VRVENRFAPCRFRWGWKSISERYRNDARLIPENFICVWYLLTADPADAIALTEDRSDTVIPF